VEAAASSSLSEQSSVEYGTSIVVSETCSVPSVRVLRQVPVNCVGDSTPRISAAEAAACRIHNSATTAAVDFHEDPRASCSSRRWMKVLSEVVFCCAATDHLKRNEKRSLLGDRSRANWSQPSEPKDCEPTLLLVARSATARYPAIDRCCRSATPPRTASAGSG